MTQKQPKQQNEYKEQDAKDVEITQLNARIENLEQQNQGLKNLLIQLDNILTKGNTLAAGVIVNIADETGDKVAAGLKLRELADLISSNAVALSEITKEWKKE